MHIFSCSLEFGKIHSREPFHTPRGSQAPHTSFQRQTHSDACYLAPSYDSLEAENYDWQLLCPPTPACVLPGTGNHSLSLWLSQDCCIPTRSFFQNDHTSISQRENQHRKLPGRGAADPLTEFSQGQMQTSDELAFLRKVQQASRFTSKW